MESHKQQDVPEGPGARPAVPLSSSRRRLLQAGLGASPVLLSMISSPVRADVVLPVGCRSASAFASIAVAQIANGTQSVTPQQTCSGLGPVKWNEAPANAWPVVKASALFRDYFPTGPTYQGISTPTLAQILSLPPAGLADTVIQKFVASMLNVLAGTTPAAVVTQLQLATMYPNVMNGTYTPIIGGTPWTLTVADSWLSQTFATT